MLDSTFLNVMFTQITLLHILLLIGMPYIVFYIFERYTKFDKFPEKWEGALFVFVIGGLITLFSIWLQEYMNVPFLISYLTLMIYLILSLWIIKLKCYPHKKINTNHTGWLRVKLNNDDIYVGKYLEEDIEYLKLGRTDSEKIRKINSKNKKSYLDAKEIIIKKFNISLIFSY